MHRVYIGLPVKHHDRYFIEDCESKVAQALTDVGIDGATIFQATGLWQGKLEQSLVVEIFNADNMRVRLFARTMRRQFHQDTVLVATFPEPEVTYV